MRFEIFFASNDGSWAAAYLFISKLFFLGAKMEFDDCSGEMSGSFILMIQSNNDSGLLSTEQHKQRRLSSVH